MRLSSDQQPYDLVVVGGGAAGFMGAITAAEEGLSSVVVLESTSKILEKVLISGGGRCNVTHACWDPKDLVNNYPRGNPSLLGSFSRFSTSDAVAWFGDKGLELTIESDGRMFPISNSSMDVIDCLKQSAISAGVTCLKNHSVKSLEKIPGKGFCVNTRGGISFFSKRILLATGGHPSGHKIASGVGHTIIQAVPSLFTFSLKTSSIMDCIGHALDDIQIKLVVGGKVFKETGRILITHWGLSGPVVLRLSAFAARELYLKRYNAELIINWTGTNRQNMERLLKEFRSTEASKSLGKSKPLKNVPRRFWLAILEQAGVNKSLRWAELSLAKEKDLLENLVRSTYKIKGRGPFGEEFVTAGGVNLKEVDLKNMESKLCEGLYFAGEIIDVDGVTGGFNFQHCWTSGWLAGRAIAHGLQLASSSN